MTKSEFITLWSRIEFVITKPVNDHIAIECDCEFIDHVGGYQLNIRPKCLLWPNELIFVLMACEVLCCPVSCDFESGSIRVY